MGANILGIKKNDFLFDTAMSAINSIKAIVSMDKESSIGIEFDRKIFSKIFENDPNSPSIYWLEDDQYVILYPPNSTPYNHSFVDKCKFIQVLSGVLFDKKSSLKLFKGDTLKVYPKDDYQPYTMEKPCYLRVCIGDCELFFDQVCK